MTAYKTVGELLKAKRTSRQMTQPQAAELAGVSIWTWNRIETGKKLPGHAYIARMCLPFDDIRPEDLEKLGLDAEADILRVYRAEGRKRPTDQVYEAIFKAQMAFTELGFRVAMWQPEPGVIMFELRASNPEPLAISETAEDPIERDGQTA